MLTVAVIGAGGAMGTRITRTLEEDSRCRLLCVENDAGRARVLAERGRTLSDVATIASEADAVVLAVPDSAIGSVARQLVPIVKSGALVIGLDPAAAFAGALPAREDIAYFLCHPSHPSIFNDENDPEARRDYFGGTARQSVVCALVQGNESDYRLGEKLSRVMWGPVLRTHRVTLEQMAILEPALSETLLGTCLTIIKEGLDEAVALGVPSEAAFDFLMGHLNVEAAVIFGLAPWSLSAGALQAIEDAKLTIFRDDWKSIFDPANIRSSAARIAAVEGA